MTKKVATLGLMMKLESGLRLPGLNHAYDAAVKVRSDLFSGGGDR